MEHFDLIIVGAGVFGLPLAKTHLQINPSSPILILDANATIGGTWSAERLYTGLNSNNLVGLLEFSDFPMDFATFGVPEGDHVPGAVVHRYLRAYAQHFGFWEKIRFRVWVVSAEMLGDGEWVVSYREQGGEGKEVKVRCKKLVLATGSTSVPNIPITKGSDAFQGSIFHFKELPKREEEMGKAGNVVVLGGSKSAADTVYVNASQGRHVDWIIRSSGKGASWLFGPWVSPFLLHFEKLATIRLMTLLSPVFNNDSPVRKLLHNTRLGRAFINGFLWVINQDLISRGRFNEHSETKKLVPPFSIYWIGTAVGIFNYPTSFFQLIRDGKVHVHRADIDSLSERTVHLSNGVDINTDMIISATGWKLGPTIPILPAHLNGNGIETLRASDPEVRKVDEEILTNWPILKDSPALKPPISSEEKDSWLLYRSLIPPSYLPLQNLAYMGAAISLRGFMVAEIQALWLCAYFAGDLDSEGKVPGVEEGRKEAVGRSRFSRLVSPMGLGGSGPDMAFETVPYVDCLLGDLGVERRRKGGWREWVGWYGVGDYKGVVGEWLESRGKARGV